MFGACLATLAIYHCCYPAQADDGNDREESVLREEEEENEEGIEHSLAGFASVVCRTEIEKTGWDSSRGAGPLHEDQETRSHASALVSVPSSEEGVNHGRTCNPLGEGDDESVLRYIDSIGRGGAVKHATRADGGRRLPKARLKTRALLALFWKGANAVGLRSAFGFSVDHPATLRPERHEGAKTRREKWERRMPRERPRGLRDEASRAAVRSPSEERSWERREEVHSPTKA